MYLIALAGLPASGKSTAAKILEDAGYPVIGMGETLRASIDWTDVDEVWDHAQDLRETHGDHGVATACVDPLRDAFENHAVAVLEGSRHPAEVNYLEDELDVQSIILWITADIEDRVTWFHARGGRGQGFEDRDAAREKLEERSQRERDAGTDRLLMLADYWVTNDQTKADLANEIVHIASYLDR